MNMTLLILAAGIGSRFRRGIKQLETVGIHDEIIMDYSIHDALEAGFNKIIFVIRKEIEQDFRFVIGYRVEKICHQHGVQVQYTFQCLADTPIYVPVNRTKPWGTGHAVLAARQLIDGPFVVINADDYYGKTAFSLAYNYFLNNSLRNSLNICMVSYVLENTLSRYGGVTRGICEVDENGFLMEISETKNICETTTGVQADGKLLNPKSLVSMNMWGFTPEFIPILNQHFCAFLKNTCSADCQEAEFLLPDCIERLLQQEKIKVKVLHTADKWFGITYQEDKAAVRDCLRELVRKGIYKEMLYSDL